MNWGLKVIVGFGAFFVMMFYFLYIANNQSNELMDKNYYEEELKHQTKIDAANNLTKHYNGTLCEIQADQIIIKIPSQLVQNFSNGNAEFINYSSQQADHKFQLAPNPDGQILIPKSKIPTRGSYKIKISWQSDDISYYKEEDMTL